MTVHTNTFKTLEAEVKAAATQIQDALSVLENVHRFSFNIEVEGRIDGDIKVEFRVGLDYDSSIFGNSVAEVINEAKRRRGWQEANRPIMISHVDGGEL